MTDSALDAIPQPPPRPLVGNLLDLRGEVPLLNLIRLAGEYGPIFRLELGKRQLLVVSGFSLVDEICDEARFDKFLGPGLVQARVIAGDGLFTAWTHEKNWQKAHNVLTPPFGAVSVRNYLSVMGDIATEMVEKWSRLNPGAEIDVAADMTRLTLDTIGLCAFSYRFNSFYHEEPDPFVDAMQQTLGFATENLSKLPIQRKLQFRRRRLIAELTGRMNSLVDRLIAERRADPEAGKHSDLLQVMLNGVDRQSGERLDLVNVRYQVLTFLVAGHETTSGLLTFVIYYLLQNPDVLAKAYAEVDAVLGGDLSKPPDEEQVRALRYLMQIVNETLRLWPTAPVFTRHARADTVLAGKYPLTPEIAVMTLIPALHRDKSIWGENPERFDPDRFEIEAAKKRPANAFRPFGTGMRACIGRYFALQEAVVALAMILQRFELVDHLGYQLKLVQTLTIKPQGFKIQVRPRRNRPAPLARAGKRAAPVPETDTAAEDAPRTAAAGMPLLVLYGSNMGTSETLAHRVAENAAVHGFATEVAPLDDFAGKLPTHGAVVVVASSYNGTPTDNAAKFVAWLGDASLAAKALAGVNFTVFGCGDHNWSDTFQRIPRLIDAGLEAHGARRVYARGEGDAADDLEGQFESWHADLFDGLAGALNMARLETGEVAKGNRYEVDVIAPAGEPESLVAEFGARPLTVAANRELQIKDGPKPSERSTRHVEFRVPAGLAYREGDHLGVLPRNAPEQVSRVLKRFGLPEDAQVRLRFNGAGKSFLPVDRPVPVRLLLSGYLAIQDAARRADIETMAEYAEAPEEKAALLSVSGEDADSARLYREEVLLKNRSVIDLLEDFPSCKLPFNLFIELVPILKPRYYSISSSPLANGGTLSITTGVVEGPARSGHGTYRGVASGYLGRLRAGDVAECFIRAPNLPFVPPADPAVPMIMVGAGTGIAPYRGFLQARAAAKAAGKSVGPALLFQGCRHPAQDHIYAAEFQALAKDGVVEIEAAYSRPNGGAKCYVQDRIAACRDKVWPLLERGAIVYVCGDASTMAPAVEQAFAAICRDKRGVGAAEAGAWLAALKSEKRYLVDIWPKS